MWIDDVLCAKIFREYEGAYLDLHRRIKADGRPRPKYVYVSVYRPLWVGWSAGIDDPLITVVHFARYSIIGTSLPIPVERLKKLELYPLTSRSKARLVIDYAKEKGVPVELGNAEQDQAIALFLNPRKVWQLSYFSVDVGPTGHLEGEDPERLLAESIDHYCRWAPGVVDAIVGGLEGVDVDADPPAQKRIRVIRFGAPVESSFNSRDRTVERGMSCYRIVAGKVDFVGWYFGFVDRPAWVGTAEQVGTGSDGEPIVINFKGRRVSRRRALEMFPTYALSATKAMAEEARALGLLPPK